MKNIILLATFCCLAAPHGAWAETIDSIAAVVNDEIITTFQLQQELRNAPATGAEEKRQVLDKMIEKTLLQQRIREIGLKVADEELDAAIADVQRQNNLTRAQLEEALRQQGMSLAEYQENIRSQILQFKLLAREVQSKIEVSNQEIRDYFREHIDEYRLAPRIRLSVVSFPLPSAAGAAQAAEVRHQAENTRDRLRQGEDFASVLTAATASGLGGGGDMGLLQKEDLFPAFQRAVRDLKEGEISDVIETPQGLHVLLLTERHAGEVRQFEDVKDEIAKILSDGKSAGSLQEWTQQLKDKAEIDIRI